MLSQARQILAGLAAAVLTAAYIVLLVHREDGGAAMSGLIPRLLRTSADLLPIGLPGAALVIAVSEGLAIRHALFYAPAGAGAVLLAVLIRHGGIPQSTLQPPDYAWTMPVLTIGVLAGLVYWGVRGRYAGLLMPYVLLPPPSTTCRTCAALSLTALSLALFAAAVWGLNKSGVHHRLPRHAEEQANAALRSSGFGWARVKIDDAVGRITGAAPNETQRAAAFAKAVAILAPMTGLPGLISMLEDEMTMAEVSVENVPD